MEKMAFTVKGMTCDHCALTIEKTLLDNPDVHSAHVSYAKGAGEVELEGKSSFGQLQEIVRGCEW